MTRHRFSRAAGAALVAVLLGSMPQGSLAATAAEPVSPAAAKMPVSSLTRLVLLGTGAGPVPRLHRSQPSSMVEINGSVYLVDAGDGVTRQLLAAGHLTSDVDQIFITHLHLDHTMGLAPLLGFSWISQKAKHVGIYGPPGTRLLVDRATTYLGSGIDIFQALLPRVPSLTELVRVTEVVLDTRQKQIYSDANVRVTGVENNHYVTTPPEKLPAGARSYSYRFDTKDRSIVFTGDTGYDEAVVKLAEGADILVSEVIDMDQAAIFVARQFGPIGSAASIMAHMRKEHMSPQDVGRMAAKARVKMVVLSHIGMATDTETDFRHYSDGVREFYKGPVIVGSDLMAF